MQSFEERLLMYRKTLRELLYKCGIPSNPAVEDNWILDRLAEQISKLKNERERPANIQNAEELEKSGLLEGDPVHLGVVGPGQWTNNAIFAGRFVRGNEITGVKVTIHGKIEEFPWADIMELWPLPSPLCLSEPQKDGRVQGFHKRVYGTAD